jgi:hypothetical protein
MIWSSSVFLLGRDAERLGIAGAPDCIRDRMGEVWPGKMAERVDLFVQVYEEGAPAK